MAQAPFDLKAAIANWRRQMLAGGIKKSTDLDELESHLLEDIDKLVQSGLTDSEAFGAATKRIGLPALVKSEFKKVENQRKSRVAELVFFISLLVFFLATTEKSHVAERFGETVGLFCWIHIALCRSGFLNHAKLVRLRPYVLPAHFIFAALLVGPEIIVQAITLLILQLIFEALVWQTGHEERRLTAARE